MPYRKIIDKPSVNLFRQQSPVTCWVASAYMLYNWKNNSNLSYDQFVMRNLPKGIYGYYLLEEKLRTSANPFDEEVFNLAFRDLDLLWDTLYITDTPQSRQARIALEHDYYHDYENHLLNNETLARLNQTSGVGLPYIHAAYFLSAHANNFKPLGQN